MLDEKLKELRKIGYSNIYCKKTRRFTAGFKGKKICECDSRDEATRVLIKHSNKKELDKRLFDMEMKKILGEEI